jgi:hypothetical protein
LQWVQDHYRTDENQTFEEGMWMGDDSNDSVFEENATFMSASHMRFDGGLFLQHIPSLQPGSTDYEGITATVPFLDLDTPWGFAFLWAPDSQETSDMMFGNPSRPPGTEMTLFHVGNNLLTIRFPKVEGVQQAKVYPVLTWMTRTTDGTTDVICREVVMNPDPNHFSGIRVDQLEQGMRLMVVFDEHVIAGSTAYSLEFQINGVSVYSDDVNLDQVLNGILAANCTQSSNPTDMVVDFGSEVTVGSEVFSGIRGRIDDLIVFDASHNTFEPIFTDFAETTSIGDLNASTSPNQRDNLFWWNFDMDENDPTVLTEDSDKTDANIESNRFQFRMKVNDGSSSGSTIAEQDVELYFITPQSE